MFDASTLIVIELDPSKASMLRIRDQEREINDQRGTGLRQIKRKMKSIQ